MGTLKRPHGGAITPGAQSWVLLPDAGSCVCCAVTHGTPAAIYGNRTTISGGCHNERENQNFDLGLLVPMRKCPWLSPPKILETPLEFPARGDLSSACFGTSGPAVLGEMILRDKTNNKRESAGESQRERDPQIQRDLEPALWHVASKVCKSGRHKTGGQYSVRYYTTHPLRTRAR